MTQPLIISSFPQAILHLDADAFFASCEQAMHPEWKGRPVVTGAERGIVAAASYEAKRAGVDRGTPLWEVKKICPDAVIVPSDYESYSLYSTRMFAIMRRFTSEVEEYSIDEAFADLTGLRRPLHGSYEQIAAQMKAALDAELGFTVSVGVSLSKTLAKVASKWNKPSGLTMIPGRRIHEFLRDLPVVKVWGIGERTAAWCHKLGIRTAWDFASKDEAFVTKHFTKPHVETWRELNGQSVLPISTETKEDYASISKTKTFTPPSADRAFVLAQLLKNLENACIKARRHHLLARGAVLFLKEQDFHHDGLEISFSRPTAYPLELNDALTAAFEKIYRRGRLYRATGVVLTGLVHDTEIQLNLFDPPVRLEKLQRLYAAVDALAEKMGKHAVRLGGTAAAHLHDPPPPHLRQFQKSCSRQSRNGSNNQSGYGGQAAVSNRHTRTFRKANRLPGETARLHVTVPVLDFKLR